MGITLMDYRPKNELDKQMNKFFDDIKNSRQISPNRFLWWNHIDNKNGWCATINEADGTQLHSEYAHNKMDAIIQAMRELPNFEDVYERRVKTIQLFDSQSPSGYEYLAEAFERIGELNIAADMWSSASAVSIGHNRSERYHAKEAHCLAVAAVSKHHPWSIGSTATIMNKTPSKEPFVEGSATIVDITETKNRYLVVFQGTDNEKVERFIEPTPMMAKSKAGRVL